MLTWWAVKPAGDNHERTELKGQGHEKVDSCVFAGDGGDIRL